jgi:hypothetical protein
MIANALILSVLAVLLQTSMAFRSEVNVCLRRMSASPKRSSVQATDGSFEVELAVPPTNSGVTARLKFGSVLPGPSRIVQVRYQLPFGLDVAPQNNLAVCTKDGAGGGTYICGSRL